MCPAFYSCYYLCSFFFLYATPTTEISPLSLHDALPISHPSRLPRESRRRWAPRDRGRPPSTGRSPRPGRAPPRRDRKSTRLNSSHTVISYAVFCLKKKKNSKKHRIADKYGNMSGTYAQH